MISRFKKRYDYLFIVQAASALFGALIGLAAAEYISRKADLGEEDYGPEQSPFE